jgi:hypothetical protein
MTGVAVERLTVLNPMGFPPSVSPKPLAPRLDSLDDKTIFLVDCRFDDSELLLKQVQGWFGEHMPNVRTEMVRLSGVYHHDDPELWQHIKANGHAAILGVGH